MRNLMIAGVMAMVLSGVALPLGTVEQRNAIAKKSSCTPDACIKAARQKGYTFATAAAWCAANNNGC
jgi:hypothetical protein